MNILVGLFGWLLYIAYVAAWLGAGFTPYILVRLAWSRRPLSRPAAFARRAVLATCLGVGLVLPSYALYAAGYYCFPTRIGPQRAFFRACSAIPYGSSPSTVLSHMRGYVLAKSMSTVDERATQLDIRPTPIGNGQASLLFYPDQSSIADFCVVTFENDEVVDVRIDPD